MELASGIVMFLAAGRLGHLILSALCHSTTLPPPPHSSSPISAPQLLHVTAQNCGMRKCSVFRNAPIFSPVVQYGARHNGNRGNHGSVGILQSINLKTPLTEMRNESLPLRQLNWRNARVLNRL